MRMRSSRANGVFFVVFGVDDDVRALVVRAVLGDFFGAGAEAGDRDGNFDADDAVFMAAVGDEGDFVVHQAFGFADRCLFFHEIGEGEEDAAFGGVQAFEHFTMQRGEAVQADGARFVQEVDEARHVRAFLVVRQGNGHFGGGDGQLRAVRRGDVQRHADVADADAGDGDVAGIGFSLDVRDGRFGSLFGFHSVKRRLLSSERCRAAIAPGASDSLCRIWGRWRECKWLVALLVTLVFAPGEPEDEFVEEKGRQQALRRTHQPGDGGDVVARFRPRRFDGVDEFLYPPLPAAGERRGLSLCRRLIIAR